MTPDPNSPETVKQIAQVFGFSPDWMAEHDIVSVGSLPVPGKPMLLVEHRIAGVLFRFAAFIVPPDFQGPLPSTPEEILAQAERQVLRGIDQRRASLVGTFL
jgi:hypothetical protein